MTPKQFADNYSKQQGYKDFADFYMNVPTNEDLENTVSGMMKAYALNVLPTRRVYTIKSTLGEHFDSYGFNQCIETIKKNIG